MKQSLIIFTLIYFALNTSCQTIDNVIGSYIKIDSTSSGYEKEGIFYKNIDTTLLTLNKDMTFSYKWSPMFGRYSETHIITTGVWAFQKDGLILNSKYQEDEHRFFESYKPEYGDTLVKVYVQTYDSLIGFFQFQFIGVIKDTLRDSQMIFKDKSYPYNACSATFNFKTVDKIVFYGYIGRMPTVIPKDKRSNHFLLQYNLSENWDYQYFKDFKINYSGDKMTLGSEESRKIVLTKI